MPDVSSRPVLDPSIPFAVHTADGQAMDLRAGAQSRPAAGFRLADADLAGYVVLDFGAFDAWYEEDEQNVAHPRDPFHRIDVLPSSRHVRLELDGQLLAESSRPTVLFETMLPARYYLPREDIRAELIPSSRRTFCAYKGQASYWSAAPGGHLLADIAWTYEQPLHDAARFAVSSRSSTSGSTSPWTVSGSPGPSRPGRPGRELSWVISNRAAPTHWPVRVPAGCGNEA